MSSTKLYIPKQIHVGYQERQDTYTGKLAYVIYTDDKGVLRKETSWKGWCKHFLEESTENVPTDGFVLNRGVGGTRQSWGHNARNEYIRVYDPRGWEIEISVSNLLFLLQECTSTKGKGLEGEFVYSWDGKELVLLPVGCEEYIASTEFTKDQGKKVTKKDMVEGRWYKFKDGNTAVYLGRHLSADMSYSRSLGKKHHIFVTDSGYVRFENGFTKIASVGEVCEDYGDKLESFLNSKNANPVVDIRWKDYEFKVGTVHGSFYIRHSDDEVYPVFLTSGASYNSWYGSRYSKYSLVQKLPPMFEEDQSVTEVKQLFRGMYTNSVNYFNFSSEMQLVKPIFILANGKEIEDVK